jgi:DNA-directed RNA polymerase specialized sigma24 family protein
MLPLSATAELDFERDLALFRGEDEFAAGEAFRRLWDAFDKRMINLLVSGGMRRDDAEDMAQIARIRFWERRLKLEIPNAGAWWGLVRKTGRNLAIDWSRGKHDTELGSWDECQDIPDEDMPYVDAIVVASQHLRRLYDAADDLWLGKTTAGDEALLAVQLCFLEGFDRDSAAHLLQVSPTQIEAWLKDAAVLARFAYRQLFWPNDALAGYVLRPEKPFTPSELDDLGLAAREGTDEPPAGWGWNEVLVVLVRLRNGLLSEQILRFEKCGMDPESLETFLAHVRTRFPFEKVAKRLLQRLDPEGETLSSGGLWRRLAFQYHVSAELPNRQVLERMEPAAALASVKMTDAMLNNWIGLGRLWSQLAAFVQEEGIS